MALKPELIGPSPSPSLPRVILATAVGTAAVFAAGILTGAALMGAPRTGSVQPAAAARPAARAFAVAPASPPQAAVHGAIPALPALGWTATARHGAVDPTLQWAATLLDASSQYTATSWSAAQVLGAPDVYPRAGDDVGAWATLTADGGRETLEVGFDRPAPIDAVHVLETYNPGAVSRVEALAPDGRTVLLFDRTLEPVRGVRAPEAGAAIRVVAGPCTPFPVERLRVTLDSHLAPGWNELDAIGVHACAP